MKIFYLAITLLVTTFTFSQNNLENKKIGDTIYYKSLRHVAKDKADEFVIIDSIKNVNGKVLYTITAYPLKDLGSLFASRKYSTHTNRLEIISPSGPTIYYHRTGKVRSKGLKNKGRNIGKWSYWYENENKHMEVSYFERDPLKKGKPSLLMNFWNEDGSQTVKDGNGSYFYITKKDSTIHKGTLVNGEKDGSWIGRYKNDKKYYDENYKKGKLIKGESWDKDGNHYSYKQEFVQPQFKRGQKGIKNIITKNFKIPKIARKNKIDGTVLVSFEVDKSGKVVNIKAFRKIHPEVDAEAIRVIKLMKGWKPAVKKGKKIKAKFAIPITYKF